MGTVRPQGRSVASGGPAPLASPSITWGPPQRSQRAEVAEIVADTGLFRPDEVEVALEVFDDYCRAPNQDYYAVAAFSDGRLAGFAFYGPTPCTVDTWDLYWIVVRPDMQGLGLGRGLIQRLERDMRSAGGRLCVIETSSRDDYSSTRGFYLACGYAEVARVPDFYDSGDDRVTYARQFR